MEAYPFPHPPKAAATVLSPPAGVMGFDSVPLSPTVECYRDLGPASEGRTFDEQSDIKMAEFSGSQGCRVIPGPIPLSAMDCDAEAEECLEDEMNPMRDETPVPLSTKQLRWATNEDWLRHKPKIVRLYWNAKKTLFQVKEIMEREEGLRAT